MQNPLEMSFSSAPKIITAICKTPKVAGGQASVKLEHFSENDLGARMSVQVVGEHPKKEARGLVLFPDGNKIETGKGFWLGELNNRFATKAENKDYRKTLPENTKGNIDDSGNNQILVSSSNSRMKSRRNTLTLSPGDFNINHPQHFDLTLDDNGFSVFIKKDNIIKSQLSVTRHKAEFLSQGNFYFQAGGSIEYNINGNFIIKGEKPNTIADLFQVKSSRIALESSHGPTTVSGSSFNVKVASSIAAPGSSSNTTASIEAVQGDMDFTAGVGDITMRALSAAHTVKVVNGFSPIGLESYIEMTGTKAIMAAEMMPGIGGEIEITRRGNISLDAFQNINMKAFLDFTSDALNTFIESAVQTKLESTILDLIASGKITVDAPLVDFDPSGLIDMGPKTTIPSSNGPLCSIPKCPILGMTHIGEKCT